MIFGSSGQPEMAKVTVTAFIEEEIKEGLKALADHERRSMSQMMAVLIERAVLDAAKQGIIDSPDQGRGKP